MKLKIQAVHFDASSKLNDFISQKVKKLDRISDDIHGVDVVLKVVKPETALNKDVSIKVSVPNEELFAQKLCNTFEEGVDLCIDALIKQLAKYKEKARGK